MPRIKDGSPAVLVLAFLLFIGFVTYLQLFCTPVMLPLIGKDLHLNTAQLGIIWGMSTFGGLFLSLPGGLLGDKIGPRWGIFIVAVITAISLGIRGFAKDTILLSAMMFVGGGVVGSLPSLVTKAIFTWFPSARVASANGIWWGFNRLGMAAGAAISVTVVVVALHGWQNTFFLYAVLLFVVAILWVLLIREPEKMKSSTGVPIREAFSESIKSRDVWFCVIANFGFIGLNVSFVGYLPIYLQAIGWKEVTSSLALTLYFLVAVVGGTILPAVSDKMRLRKPFFLVPVFIYITGIGLMSVMKATSELWILVVIIGLVYGSLGPMLNSIVAEIKGIGSRYAGTAISIGTGIGGGAGLLFAAISGKLALTNAELPFIFGTLLCFICLIPFFFTRETGKG